MEFICAFDGPWHVAKDREFRNSKGELWHTAKVTVCTNRQIGGAWGPRTWKHAGSPSPICKNCQKILARKEPK